jgi:hypothetical protein
MKNKKGNVAVIAFIIVIVAITTAVITWRVATKKQVQVQKEVVAQSEQVAQPQSKTQSAESVEQPIENIKAGYKKVTVSDGAVSFSFAVPEKWLTETRHSGEKQLSIEEMRDFLATSYDGNIKTNNKLTSSYADFPWDMLKKMSSEEIKRYYFRTDSDMPFPNASVSAGEYIQYTDTSWQQIDFYLKSESASSEIAKIKQRQNEYCKEYGNDIAGCGNDAPKLSKTVVDGKDVTVLTYSTDKDEKGNELISKGGTGGKNLYIDLPNSNKTLAISKQAKGDAQFEKDFEYLIQTLKFVK